MFPQFLFQQQRFFGSSSSKKDAGPAATTMTEPSTSRQAIADKSPAAFRRPIAPVGEAEELQRYVALCKEANAETPAVRMLQLKQFMIKRGMPEYDGLQVHQYLVGLARERYKKTSNNQRILWRPLRAQDQNIFALRWYNWDRIEDGVYLEHDKQGLYSHLLPGSVMETARTIYKEFPDANFLVSEIEDVLDPFLAVAFPTQTMLIVDFWAEPGFKPVSK